MANPEHLEILKRGVDEWNAWRDGHRGIQPDLTGADLRGANLEDADLQGAILRGADLGQAVLVNAFLANADLYGANLSGAELDLVFASEAIFTTAHLTGASLLGARLHGAYLARADLRRAGLSGAKLYDADLNQANLAGAHLAGAHLSGADLSRADLTGANLSYTNLEGARLVQTTLTDCTLSGSRVYGVSVWDALGQPCAQRNLVVTPHGEAQVTTDNLVVAQFVHLLLNNENFRDIINSITARVALILGRFTPERKRVLDALRDELRKRNLTPVLFDFEVPADRDMTETVTLLARMARFIVADLTDPASIPLELQAIAPDVAVPIRSIVHKDQEPFSMFVTLKKYHWVLDPYQYDGLEQLIADLDGEVIAPAEAKREELDSTR
jgi:uncharacterized protein YjbI with pentapeptide repeats